MTLDEILVVVTEAEKARLYEVHGATINAEVQRAIDAGVDHDDAWNEIGRYAIAAYISEPLKASEATLRDRARTVEHALRVTAALCSDVAQTSGPAGVVAALAWHLRKKPNE